MKIIITCHYQVWGLRRSTLCNNTTKQSLKDLDSKTYRGETIYKPMIVEFLVGKGYAAEEVEVKIDYKPRQGKPLTKPEVWAESADASRDAWKAHRYAMMELMQHPFFSHLRSVPNENV